jgi:hypothetical protein
MEVLPSMVTFILVFLVVNLAWSLATQLAQSPYTEFRQRPAYYTFLSAVATIPIVAYLIAKALLVSLSVVFERGRR